MLPPISKKYLIFRHHLWSIRGLHYCLSSQQLAARGLLSSQQVSPFGAVSAIVTLYSVTFAHSVHLFRTFYFILGFIISRNKINSVSGDSALLYRNTASTLLSQCHLIMCLT
ncbi:hypothetical protein CEXT_238051 [Caerostris extrusa]|uniref:Uncharacterized protein n=1 Tax=Caerostris extrusa TaxID=172846 RepID=A0AAV4UGU6_CAEEX|nr:hypothetical protein CEXT_238051 [Caerostris extrusa]